MSGLKALKIRIGSVKSTRKITKAMQMVAAAKLRRVQDAAQAGRPYADALERILTNLTASSEEMPKDLKLLSGTGSDKKVLLLVMTADRGLCGGFNASIIKYARECINKLLAESKTVVLMSVGRRAGEALQKTHGSFLLKKRNLSEVKHIDYHFAEAISADILSFLTEEKFDICHIISSEFKSVISQVPTMRQLIPVCISHDTEQTDYEVEPDVASVLADILPKNLTVQIYTALLENIAGEQGARMSAMDNATRNAGDMINRLTLLYNRTRQANITKELIEIISGAEAL